MQNTISCTDPVQNAAYCTGLAANAGSSVSGKDCEAGRQHQSECNCRSSTLPIQGPEAGSTQAITRPAARSNDARMLVNGRLT